jgi:hypothetical protein
MRHIPEDELHAYLDQGLSRSQCVEIESHLAGCPTCRATRDGIAALRDRTTALLAKLAPPRRIPPAFDSLRHLAAQRVSARRRRLSTVAWAASLFLAVGLGWSASRLVEPDRRVTSGPGAARPPAAQVAAPATLQSGNSAPIRHRPTPSVATSAPPHAAAGRESARPVSPAASGERRVRRDSIRAAREDSIRSAKLAVLDQTPALELVPLERPRPGGSEQFEGMWRTMSWDGAQSEAGRGVPHIDGLPVIRVQVQANDQGKRPLMVVAQQLASGDVIQMIEGPASDVSELLSRRAGTANTSPDGSLSVSMSRELAPGDQAMAMQVGDRMLAITGALPSDSLRAMIRRINAEMRTK